MNWKSQVSSNRKHISNELLELRHLFISCNKKSWTCWAHTHNKELTVKMGFRFGWLSSSIIRFRFMVSLSARPPLLCVLCFWTAFFMWSCGVVGGRQSTMLSCFQPMVREGARKKVGERDTSLQPWKKSPPVQSDWVNSGYTCTVLDLS